MPTSFDKDRSKLGDSSPTTRASPTLDSEKGSESQPRNLAAGPSTPGGSSYVYPVRSLLAGVQPARGTFKAIPPGVVGIIGAPTPDNVSNATTQLKKEKESPLGGGGSGRLPSPVEGETPVPFPRESPSQTPRDSYFHPLPTGSKKASTASPTSPLKAELKAVAENLFMGGDPTPKEEAGPKGGQHSIILAGDRDADEYNPRHPEPISSAGADILATTYTTPSLAKPRPTQPARPAFEHQSSKPLDFSKTGIVHLPPLPRSSTSASGSDRATSTSGIMSGGSLSSGRGPGFGLQSPLDSGGDFDPRSRSGMGRSSGVSSAQGAGMSGSESAGDSAGGSAMGQRSNSGISTSSSELVSFNFKHVRDENGFLVVTGRDGKLVRCEDEPIHAPGAVQGYGVLIVVEEDDDTGNLVVRQVSENSTELLGLSPRFLFSLDCFTQTLPDSQSDLLWDNVQFLHDSELEVDGEANDHPQVFLLSGWGEPGTVVSEEDENSEKDIDGRKYWTCWCAAHRPPAPIQKRRPGQPPVSQPFTRSLIVLEFELERDLYNPLYPPFQSEMMSTVSPDSQVSSRSSGMGSGSSTATTFSQASISTGAGSTGGSTTEMNAPARNASGVSSPLSSIVEADSPELISQSNPTTPLMNPAEIFLSTKQGLEGDQQWFPSPEDIFESTTSHAKPLKALERMRRINRTFAAPGIEGSAPTDRPGNQSQSARQRARTRRGGSQAGVGTMDIFAVLAQVNDQLSSAPDIDSFLKVVVGVIKDLTQFNRVLIYQFDDQWNGQVVAELVDWRQTHDLYKGLHFPASDIPAQARELYKINKVRMLYDRSQVTARLVVRTKEDLEAPLDMTHSFLRAMSPIHIKYLENMGVRSSMSVSIITFGALWGLISCHSYGPQGMRVSFPVRQMLRLLSDSVSRNIERLSYAQRLHTRKLISTLPTDTHPTGYIVSNAEDLLGLFDADFGVLVIGEGAKILGPNQHGQEILLVAEYLRLKQFTLMQVSQSVVKDFPDLQLPSGLEVIAGLLCVPLSRGGKDFIAFLRKGQLRDVHWAGKPYKDGDGAESVMEPRKSFKTWSETIAGRCRVWTDEQMETAGVLALVYGKFIEVWRQKESALQATQLTTLLLSNASHEVRTPLNHIINYLEMALNGPLDNETRENLALSHSASKSLLFTINDLLDLTRLESGNETSFNEPFDLQETITEAVQLYKNEAERRLIRFDLDLSNSPKMVIGDAKKIRTVVANLTANAVKFTAEGTITVLCHKFKEPRGLRNSKEVAVEIVVGDTGCGMESSKLESIFREFEQVESTIPKQSNSTGLGLGLAVVARIVEQLGGQLRVDSKPGEGSRFSFLIPFELVGSKSDATTSTVLDRRSRTSSGSSEIDSIVEALSSDHMRKPSRRSSSSSAGPRLALAKRPPKEGTFEVTGSRYPIRSVRVDEFDADKAVDVAQITTVSSTPMPPRASTSSTSGRDTPLGTSNEKLRVLVVEDDHINRAILAKRLTLDGHTVVSTTNGKECVETVQADREFDCILMDIQMPLLNGFEASRAIREMEKDISNDPTPPATPMRLSKKLNGRIPIFAVSASLFEKQRKEMVDNGFDGWILKPIEFKRMREILSGILDLRQREKCIYHKECNWEAGGWLEDRKSNSKSATSKYTSPSTSS